MHEEKTHLGLTKPELDNLMQIVRYGIIIIMTVLITFTIVASITNFFGYTPPQPSNYEVTTEATLIND